MVVVFLIAMVLLWLQILKSCKCYKLPIFGDSGNNKLRSPASSNETIAENTTATIGELNQHNFGYSAFATIIGVVNTAIG
jgi:hypothetical protein